MRPARQITSWLGAGFPPPLDETVLHCGADLRDEIFASLEFYSEIKTSGKELLRANGHTNLADSFSRFQAYVRQARTFYEGAEALHHRASPLNFYYAFMNLAKALILLRKPTFVNRKLTHGIIYRPITGSLRKQAIEIGTHGVFPLFYEIATNHRLTNNSKLRITDLFGYASDVEFEYRLLKYGTYKSFRSKFAVGINRPTQKASSILVIERFIQSAPKTFLRHARNLFDGRNVVFVQRS